MTDIAVQVENIGKAYRIAHSTGRRDYKTLQEDIVQLLKRPFGRSDTNAHMETFWALKDLSFTVLRGEAIGIIGHNGAGKSTLLKILSRITKPTEGHAKVSGRVGSLLEVGTGFHPELTGRENVYLNGAILGMLRRDIDIHFDEIVAFAEIEQFLDTPVKRYSSGMYMRLAFAVAAHLKPEILIIDEVLAVGDAAFQKKSMGKMSDAAHSGRTVLFVSHNMSAIENLCTRVLWLDGGRLRAEGSATSIVKQYMDAVERGDLTTRGRSRVQIKRVWLQDEHGQVATTFTPGDTIDIRIAFSTQERFEQPYFSVTIESRMGSVCCANMVFDGRNPAAIEGDGVIGCVFRNMPLMPQPYTVRLVVYSSDAEQYLYESQEIARFNVVGAMSDYAMLGERADHFAQYAVPLVMPYEWLLPDGTCEPVALTRTESAR